LLEGDVCAPWYKLCQSTKGAPELPRTPDRRSSRQRESVHRAAPIGQVHLDEGCLCRRVLWLLVHAQTEPMSNSVRGSGWGYTDSQVHPKPPSSHHLLHTYDHPTTLCACYIERHSVKIAPTRVTLPEAIFVKGGRSYHTREAAAYHRGARRTLLHEAEAQVHKGWGLT